MLRGRVIGNVWATKRLEEIPNGAFLEVEVEPEARASSRSTCWAAVSASTCW